MTREHEPDDCPGDPWTCCTCQDCTGCADCESDPDQTVEAPVPPLVTDQEPSP